MKKILSLILGVVLLFSLVGCREKDVDKNSFESAKEYVDGVKSEREQKEEKEREQFESNKKSINEEVSLLGCTLKLKEYSIVDSAIFDDTKCIAITFDYTNNGETDNQFCNFINGYIQPTLNLYQDGVKLKTHGSSKLIKGHGTIIKPGATTEVIYVFALQNESSDIEVELKNYDSESSTCTLKLN
jgi:hypothetical protein